MTEKNKERKEEEETRQICVKVSPELFSNFMRQIGIANKRRKILGQNPLTKSDVLREHITICAGVGILDEQFVGTIVGDKKEVLRKVATVLAKQVYKETGRIVIPEDLLH